MALGTNAGTGRPWAVFNDTALMTDRRVRQQAVLLSLTHDVVVGTTMGDAKGYWLSEWLAANAEMILLMMRLRATC